MPNTAFSPFGSAAFGSGFPELGDLDFSGYGSSVFKDSVPGYGGQVFTPSPEKPGNSFAQTALGVGALAEGIGNVIRGIKGMDPAPPGMATSALASFFQQQPDTSNGFWIGCYRKLNQSFVGKIRRMIVLCGRLQPPRSPLRNHYIIL